MVDPAGGVRPKGNTLFLVHAGSADRDSSVVLQGEDRHVFLGNFIPFDVTDCLSSEISGADDFASRDFGERFVRVD